MNNLVIKYGFQSIIPNFILPNNKGLNLNQSGHVFNVEEHRLGNSFCKIIGFVVRQTSVTLEPYKVELELDDARNLKYASCQCPAGSGSRCKHIVVVIAYVNSEDGTSKTDEPQQWGKPSKMEQTIYHQEVNVNEEIIKQIFNQTLNQYNDKLWSHHRKIRISASLKAHKIKVSRNTSIDGQTRLAMSLINENTITGQGLSNVLYGSQTEKKAIEIFSTMFNLKVLKCGLVVHKDQPWLCASPDGLIIKNNKINSALEIKCPISCKKKKTYY
ncbi:hypothetical protein ACI65C_013849 [Semiaphis heraclei]